MRRLEPHRLQGMEYYSTALWHLQKEVALSTLAQELTDFDIKSPQVSFFFFFFQKILFFFNLKGLQST